MPINNNSIAILKDGMELNIAVTETGYIQPCQGVNIILISIVSGSSQKNIVGYQWCIGNLLTIETLMEEISKTLIHHIYIIYDISSSYIIKSQWLIYESYIISIQMVAIRKY